MLRAVTRRSAAVLPVSVIRTVIAHDPREMVLDIDKFQLDAAVGVFFKRLCDAVVLVYRDTEAGFQHV
ncbi:MAG: hypothetical protein ACEQSX_20215 [Baekduiaceae bacterium]